MPAGLTCGAGAAVCFELGYVVQAGDARAAVRMLDDHLSHAKEALSKVFASYSRMNG